MSGREEVSFEAGEDGFRVRRALFDWVRRGLPRKPREVEKEILHRGFLVIEIGGKKPDCVVCGRRVPKGRHYTCSDRCQRKEKIRVRDYMKRLREARQPKMSLSKKVGDALRGLFE